MSETPRACEYCGQSCIEPQRIIPVHDTVGWVARCGHCQAQGPMKDTPEQAIAAWNKRAGDADYRRLRELERAVRGILMPMDVGNETHWYLRGYIKRAKRDAIGRVLEGAEGE